MRSEDLTPRGTRHAQRMAHRRRARRIALAVAVAVVVAGVALVATDTLMPGHASGGPRLLHTGDAATGARDAGSDAGVPTRPLTPDQPLRLWIAGDSLAGSLGPSLGEMTAATGVVQPVFDSRVSSGLTTPSFFDWPRHAQREVARLDPEAIVFIIGANDARIAPDGSNGQALDAGWKAQYQTLVDQMLSTFASGTTPRTIYWVGAPTMRDSAFSKRVKELDDAVRDVVARHPGVVYVDSYSLFAGPDGKYASKLPDVNGTTVQMRAGDGIHFTPDGGDRLAGAVFKLLDAKWHITAQAVPSQAKTVIQTEGSTQVPGTSRKLRSRTTNTTTARRGTSSGGSGTTPTTSASPSTTQAPATSPPVSEPPPSVSTSAPSGSTTSTTG
jgi:hypothetical protein